MRRKGKKDFSRSFVGQILTVRELKSIHATKAMRGCQNMRVSSNSKR